MSKNWIVKKHLLTEDVNKYPTLNDIIYKYSTIELIATVMTKYYSIGIKPRVFC